MREKEWPRVNRWIRLFLAILIVVAFFVLVGRLDNIESNATARDRFVLLGVLFVFHLPALLRSTKLYCSLRHESVAKVRHHRPALSHICFGILSYLPLAFVLLISFGRLWTFEAIGFSSRMHWAWPIVAGVGWAIIFKVVLAYVYRFASRQTKDSPDSFEASLIRRQLFRGHMARTLGYFNLVIISPTFEEFIYRGFFVYFVGHLFGTIIAGVLTGLLLCVWLHIYMGPSTILSVISFFVASIVLLYSPFGLLSVISFHAACNAHYMVDLQLQSVRYLNYVRSCRLSRTSTTQEALGGSDRTRCHP